MTKRAILSVYDKTDLIEFAQGLARLGWELVASGGTARQLRESGLDVTAVSTITHSPEILGGRVKTLHPAIHGGILARNIPDDSADLAAQGIQPIDLVVCNLYPFRQTIAQPDVTLAAAVEQIDIGGVTLLRAAAKNFVRVAVVCDPADYVVVLEGLRDGTLDEAARRQLAAKAFAHTRDYDTAITAYIGEAEKIRKKNLLPERISLNLSRTQSLRYGENPHQAAALYAANPDAGPLGGSLLQGKPLSYNNLLDLDAAQRAVQAFDEPTAVIVKHLSPCGIASAKTAPLAFPPALASDPVSAFGSVIAVNRPVDAAFAEAVGAAKLFVEAVIAPGFSPEAQTWFAQHKKNCRLVAVLNPTPPRLELRAITGGFLAQEADGGDPSETEWQVVSQRHPTNDEWAALRFGWTAVQHVKSNAIVFASGTATVGIGGGLPSRVDAVKLAAAKAGDKAEGAIMASDAFFPFPDGVEEAAKVGVTAVIEPGGSIRDEAVIETADKLGLALVFTSVRHFRH